MIEALDIEEDGAAVVENEEIFAIFSNGWILAEGARDGSVAVFKRDGINQENTCGSGRIESAEADVGDGDKEREGEDHVERFAGGATKACFGHELFMTEKNELRKCVGGAEENFYIINDPSGFFVFGDYHGFG